MVHNYNDRVVRYYTEIGHNWIELEGVNNISSQRAKLAFYHFSPAINYVNSPDSIQWEGLDSVQRICYANIYL